MIHLSDLWSTSQNIWFPEGASVREWKKKCRATFDILSSKMFMQKDFFFLCVHPRKEERGSLETTPAHHWLNPMINQSRVIQTSKKRQKTEDSGCNSLQHRTPGWVNRSLAEYGLSARGRDHQMNHSLSDLCSAGSMGCQLTELSELPWPASGWDWEKGNGVETSTKASALDGLDQCSFNSMISTKQFKKRCRTVALTILMVYTMRINSKFSDP